MYIANILQKNSSDKEREEFYTYYLCDQIVLVSDYKYHL